MTDTQAKNLFAFVGAVVVFLLMVGVGATFLNFLKDDDSRTITSRAKETSLHNYYYANGEWAYNVVVIDGCEYIQKGHGFAHKGNCTNSIHIYRAENGK